VKILILGDGQGWIVDRIVDRMVEGIPHDFTVRYYTKIEPAELLVLSREHDLVHYGNWDLRSHRTIVHEIVKHTPFLLSIRSHRYGVGITETIAKKSTAVHICGPTLIEKFPEAVWIPDGIFDRFAPTRPFVVGCAAKLDASEYKGVSLIAEACRDLGVEFRRVGGEVPPDEMPSFYEGLDLYVCASEAEGFGAPVMECLAMNIPVITTDVGVASILPVNKIERSVEGIKRGIQQFYTSPLVWPQLSFDRVCTLFTRFYEEIVKKYRGEPYDFSKCEFKHELLSLPH